MHTIRALTILALLFLTACKAEIELADNSALSAELLQADRDFAALSENTNPKQAFAAYLSSNAMLIGRSGDPIVGYDAAIASFGDAVGLDLHWQPQFAEVATAGDMGWTWGRYQLLMNDEPLYSGKYVNIWTRQTDGSWKVRLDVGNQEPE